jgi:hypothetical protein
MFICQDGTQTTDLASCKAEPSPTPEKVTISVTVPGASPSNVYTMRDYGAKEAEKQKQIDEILNKSGLKRILNSSGSQSNLVTDIQFLTQTKGYAIIEGKFFSYDGNRWQEMNSRERISPTSIYMMSPTEGYAGQDKYCPLLKFDGIVWNYTEPYDQIGINNLKMLSSSFGFGIGYDSAENCPPTGVPNYEEHGYPIIYKYSGTFVKENLSIQKNLCQERFTTVQILSQNEAYVT